MGQEVKRASISPGRTILLQFLGLILTIVPFFMSLALMIVEGARSAFTVKPRPTPPEVLQDPNLGEHRYVHLPGTGIKLHIVVKGPADKPLMLFVHGFPEFWYSWRHQLKHFSNKYFCVAVDNRGYGDSDKPNGVENYSVRLLSEDLKELVKALGYEKCVLVGHDWGGIIGYVFCARFPEMVTKYFALNIAHPMAFRERSLSQALKSWYVYFFQCPYIPEMYMRLFDLSILDTMLTRGIESKSITDEEVEAYKYTFCKPGAFTYPINYYRCMIRNPADTPVGATKKITVPVITIFGAKDKYVGMDTARKSAKFVENFTFKEVPEAAHFVQMDAPDVVNSFMEEYL